MKLAEQIRAIEETRPTSRQNLAVQYRELLEMSLDHDDEMTAVEISAIIEILGYAVADIDADLGVLAKYRRYKNDIAETNKREKAVDVANGKLKSIQAAWNEERQKYYAKIGAVDSEIKTASAAVARTREAERELPKLIKENVRLFNSEK